MKIYDISVTLEPNLVTWCNSEVGIERKWMGTLDKDGANVSAVTLGSHAGTHLDAPLHFIANGRTVEQLDLNDLIGACTVVEFGDLPQLNITAADLESAGIPPGCKRVLFKTANSRRTLLRDPQFHRDFVAIAPDAAQWLVARGLRTVGVDYLSVGAIADNTGGETHRILLGAGLVLLEGLLLEEVPAGKYQLVALPLKIQGAEGCPMRAVLFED